MTEVWKSLKPSNSCVHFPLSLETEVLRESGRKGQNGPGLTVFDWREAEGGKLKQDWVHLYSCLRCSLSPANAATEIREGKQGQSFVFSELWCNGRLFRALV